MVQIHPNTEPQFNPKAEPQIPPTSPHNRPQIPPSSPPIPPQSLSFRLTVGVGLPGPALPEQLLLFLQVLLDEAVVAHLLPDLGPKKAVFNPKMKGFVNGGGGRRFWGGFGGFKGVSEGF